MIINRDSWHYRLIGWVDFRHPDNLCAYFWMTVIALLIIPGGAFLIAFGAALLSMPLWWWLSSVPVGFAILIGGLDIVVLSFLLRIAVGARHDAEMIRGERERPTQSLFGAWIHAKHRKICPLLDFE